jgi:hypothetical protein
MACTRGTAVVVGGDATTAAWWRADGILEDRGADEWMSHDVRHAVTICSLRRGSLCIPRVFVLVLLPECYAAVMKRSRWCNRTLFFKHSQSIHAQSVQSIELRRLWKMHGARVYIHVDRGDHVKSNHQRGAAAQKTATRRRTPLLQSRIPAPTASTIVLYPTKKCHKCYRYWD